MRDCYRGREPFDLRLLVLRLLHQSGSIIWITVLGILVFGGGYFLTQVVFAGKQYVATSWYQVEYVLDPVTGNEYTYINGTTWNQWLRTQEFLDLLYANLEGTEEAQIDRETMKGYLSADLQSDLRMPDTKVTTEDPALSIRIAAAVEDSMVEFAQGQVGIDNIRVVDPAVTAEDYNEARPLNACILSGVVTLFLTVVFLSLRELGSCAIWLPATLKNWFGLTPLGTEKSGELPENIAWCFRDCERIGVLKVGEKEPGELLARLSVCEKPAGARWVMLPDAALCPEVCGQIRGMDGLLLAVEAGRQSGARLEKTLEYLAVQDCAVTAAVLYHADEKLIQRYYAMKVPQENPQ